MDIEEIEIMARCAGLMKYITPPGTREWHGTIDDLAKLVNGVIRNEREACAKVCDDLYEAGDCALAIRERSNE